MVLWVCGGIFPREQLGNINRSCTALDVVMLQIIPENRNVQETAIENRMIKIL